MNEARCWCGHQEVWHITLFVADICRWCVKMEQRHPQFNFKPRHTFSVEWPEGLLQEAAEAVEQVLKRPGHRCR